MNTGRLLTLMKGFPHCDASITPPLCSRDGIRAVDYLETCRPEIDTSTLGLTGCSGGGTMSSWLWAMEPRFTMAAPNCFVTTYLHNLENESAPTIHSSFCLL